MLCGFSAKAGSLDNCHAAKGGWENVRLMTVRRTFESQRCGLPKRAKRFAIMGLCDLDPQRVLLTVYSGVNLTAASAA